MARWSTNSSGSSSKSSSQFLVVSRTPGSLLMTQRHAAAHHQLSSRSSSRSHSLFYSRLSLSLCVARVLPRRQRHGSLLAARVWLPALELSGATLEDQVGLVASSNSRGSFVRLAIVDRCTRQTVKCRQHRTRRLSSLSSPTLASSTAFSLSSCSCLFFLLVLSPSSGQQQWTGGGFKSYKAAWSVGRNNEALARSEAFACCWPIERDGGGATTMDFIACSKTNRKRMRSPRSKPPPLCRRRRRRLHPEFGRAAASAARPIGDILLCRARPARWL